MEVPSLIYKIKPFSGKIFNDNTSTLQKFDPYLVIRYGSSSYYTGVSKNTGKFPYWNDSFTFKKNNQNDEKIWIECWDYNVDFDADKEVFLGKGELDCSKCINDKKTLVWASIERPKSSNNEEMEKSCELLIEIELSTNNQQVSNEAIDIETEENEEKNVDTEKEAIILEEINPNVLKNEKEVIEIIDEPFNNQQPIMYQKPQPVNIHNEYIKIAQPSHISQRSYHAANGLIPNKIIHGPATVPLQNYGGRVINMRPPQNTNMMYYPKHTQPIHYP